MAGVSLAGTVAGADSSVRGFVQRYCFECHDTETKKGALDLETISADLIAKHSAIWEKVVRQLDARHMPPAGKDRPDEAGYRTATAALTVELDANAAAHPRPGRTDTLRRLTRTEYQNAIRDLLDVGIDAKALLPADESSHGFDNVTVGDLSPALLDRYVTAAQKISRLAVGSVSREPQGETVRVRPDITQEEHVPGLPLGTRGGALIRHTFPQDGTYEVQIHLMRDRNELVEGLHRDHELEVLVDRERVASFTVSPPPDRKDYTKVDANLKTRFFAKAGPHGLGVTFVKDSGSVLERLRQPYQASFNFHRHPRLSPAVYEVSIIGPFDAKGAGDTPSRRRLFGENSEPEADVEARARRVLEPVMRRAYRRPVTEADINRPLAFFREASRDGEAGFDAGIEAALSAILIGSEFLFRAERDPPDLPAKTPYFISDFELASRLSFFFWSSIPDDPLLAAAERRGSNARPAGCSPTTDRSRW
jgi:Protein of unknown function (DUF1587)/Protein of unknown function (DUF1595)/Protein of unknown function (DUF1592)/Planctomycete cytochrome C